MPWVPYSMGNHFFGRRTEKLLAAINRVPRAFAECPGVAGYYSLPEWEITFCFVRAFGECPGFLIWWGLLGFLFGAGDSFFLGTLAELLDAVLCLGMRGEHLLAPAALLVAASFKLHEFLK